MNDLLLWRLLGEEDADPSQLVELLKQLAELPLPDRFPLFTRISAGLDHSDPQVRAAAVASLAGADGPHAWRRLVAALDDEAEEVRKAAVEALRQSATADTDRWVHALFHPRSDVRRMALSGRSPRGAEMPAPYLAEMYVPYLAYDEVCRDLALQRLPQAVGAASHLVLIGELVRDNIISRSQARQLMVRMLSRNKGILEWYTHLPYEDDAADTDQTFASPAAQAVVSFVDMFFDEEAEQELDPRTGKPVSQQFFGFFSRKFCEAERRPTDRAERAAGIVAVVLETAERRAYWNPHAAELCAVFDRMFFLRGNIPLEVRHRAVQGLCEYGVGCARTDRDILAIALGVFGKRVGGKLRIDIRVLGALLQHVAYRPPDLYLWEVIARYGILSAAFESNVPGLEQPFLAITVEKWQGLLERIVWLPRDKKNVTGFLARLLHGLMLRNQEKFHDTFYRYLNDFCGTLDDSTAAGVVFKICEVASKDGTKLNHRNIAILAHILDQRSGTWAQQKFLQEWLAKPVPDAVGREVVTHGVYCQHGRGLETVMSFLSPADAGRLLLRLAYYDLYKLDRLEELAVTRLEFPDEFVRYWAQSYARPQVEGKVKRVSDHLKKLFGPSKSIAAHNNAWELPDVVKQGIAECPDELLGSWVAPCITGRWRGLAETIARRPPPTAPSAVVCAALLASKDELADIGQQFVRFASDRPNFVLQITRYLYPIAFKGQLLSFAGNAWISGVPNNLIAFGSELTARRGSLSLFLASVSRLESSLLRRRMWIAACHWLIYMQRLRDVKPGNEELWEMDIRDLVPVLIDQLESKQGDLAASMLHLVDSHWAAGPSLIAGSPRIVKLWPKLKQPVRRRLKPWIAKMHAAYLNMSDDLDELSAHCELTRAEFVTSAARRLMALGPQGVQRLAEVLTRQRPVACARSLADTISSWPAGRQLVGLRAYVTDASNRPQLRFRIGIELLARGEHEVLDDVLEAACRPTPRDWFREGDWRRLVELARSPRDVAVRLARAPHSEAYHMAMRQLMDGPLDKNVVETLRSFLDFGTSRLQVTRYFVASTLYRNGDRYGWPALLQGPWLPQLIDPSTVEEDIKDIVSAVLVSNIRWDHVLPWINQVGPSLSARLAGMERLLVDTPHEWVRREILEWRQIRRIHNISPSRHTKLQQLAEVFHWGLRRGRELTGRTFQIELISSTDLGYTRLTEPKIYVNPLPLFRQEPHGRDVVRGLILHEFGHHVYHASEEALKCAEQAQREDLFKLLNVVADEHLERNLRAMRNDDGDLLKRLNAYAFHYSSREIRPSRLLPLLGSRTFEVLHRTRLHVARERHHVRVNNGEIFTALGESGQSFARFLRCQRMGLGDRYGDPKVQEALQLFRGGSFRKSSMEELLAIARRLREIFGEETELLKTLGVDWLLRPVLGDEARPTNLPDTPEGAEIDALGEGITDEEITDEIKQITSKPDRPPTSRQDRGGGALLNVGEDKTFDTITNVVRLQFDRNAHRELVRPVLAHARRFRRYLEHLGLTRVPVRRQLAGRAVDRAGLRNLVLRRDPRFMVSQLQVAQDKTDLFMGVLVDCSGSMHGQKLERAKTFAAMLTEAVRQQPNVDLRIFGFTDQVIYDAGNQARPAIAAMRSSGGNNDAAALWHAAQCAMRSGKKEKLLIMISDGCPTECSVNALRDLVGKLTDQRICCAQLAVEPLPEICFPHYVELQHNDLHRSVREFGKVVARLIRMTLGGRRRTKLAGT